MSAHERISHQLSFLVALLLSACIVYYNLPDFLSPSFPGDSGIRLSNSDQLIVRYGQRVWLPFVQFHLFLLHPLQPPLWVLKCIPLLYLAAFSYLTHLLAQSVVGGKRTATAYSSFVLLTVVFSRPMDFVQLNFYQEIPALAFFHLLLYLFFYRSGISWTFVFFAAVSMSVREVFWIYYAVLLAFLFLRRRKPKTSAEASFLLLPSIPVLWLMLTGQGLLPQSDTTEQVLTTALILERIEDLYLVLYFNAMAAPMLLWVFALALSVYYFQTLPDRLRITLLQYTLFSCAALLLMYGQIVYEDPWQNTPLNRRMALPLLLHLPFSLFLLLESSKYLPARIRILQRALLIAIPLLLTFW